MPSFTVKTWWGDQTQQGDLHYGKGNGGTGGADPTPEPGPPRKGRDIVIIDSSDDTGMAEARSRHSPLKMTGAQDMVDTVIKELGPGEKIGRLTIGDHGDPYSFDLGSDEVTVKSMNKTYGKILSQLQGYFAPDGYVYLEHCQVGQNQELLKLASQAFGVSVVAGTGDTYPVFRYNTGDYVWCNPYFCGQGRGSP